MPKSAEKSYRSGLLRPQHQVRSLRLRQIGQGDVTDCDKLGQPDRTGPAN